MAKQGNGAAKKGGGAKKAADKATRRENAGITKAAASKYAREYNALLDEKDKMNGEIMSDVKNLLEKAANETGYSRKVMRTALTEHRKELKRRAAEKEMEPDERNQLHSAREALGTFADTPLGMHAVEEEEAGGGEEHTDA